MAEYISKEKAIKELREVYENEYPTASGDFDEYASHDVPNVLRNMKVADVQRVKRGEWGKRAYNRVQCSYCGKCEDIASDFCPNCGADMRGDENG